MGHSLFEDVDDGTHARLQERARYLQAQVNRLLANERHSHTLACPPPPAAVVALVEEAEAAGRLGPDGQAWLAVVKMGGRAL